MAPDSEPQPAFDEDFIKSASFTEPSARDRAQQPKRSKRPGRPSRPRGPGPLARWRSRRGRTARPGLDDDRARAKTLLIIGGLVLVAVLLAVVVGPAWQIQFKLP